MGSDGIRIGARRVCVPSAVGSSSLLTLVFSISQTPTVAANLSSYHNNRRIQRSTHSVAIGLAIIDVHDIKL